MDVGRYEGDGVGVAVENCRLLIIARLHFLDASVFSRSTSNHGRQQTTSNTRPPRRNDKRHQHLYIDSASTINIAISWLERSATSSGLFLDIRASYLVEP
jgi:hypothetical protein